MKSVLYIATKFNNNVFKIISSALTSIPSRIIYFRGDTL